MPKTIQMRAVPNHVHRRLKIHAAEAGLSLSDYLIREFSKVVELPSSYRHQNELSSFEAKLVSKKNQRKKGNAKRTC